MTTVGKLNKQTFCGRCNQKVAPCDKYVALSILAARHEIRANTADRGPIDKLEVGGLSRNLSRA